MTRFLVTGAAGFIGSHVCRAALDAGHQVVGLDNFDPFYTRELKEAGLAGLLEHPAFEFIEGDIRDRDTTERALRHATAVVHLAARPGVRPSIEDPLLYTSINVLGTVNLLESCAERGLRRFVFGSSSSVYGDSTPVPFREDAPAVEPISPYAATKRAGELLCQVYAHLHGFRVACLRFFTVYGPRQRPDLAIHKFTRLLAEGRPLPQYGDGSAERDHTHVDDVLQGVLGAMNWVLENERAFEVFNLGESRTVRLDSLIRLIAAALGLDPVIEKLPMQQGDVRRTYADIEKARRVLGYDPKVTIEEGIPRFVRWYEEAYGRPSRTAS